MVDAALVLSGLLMGAAGAPHCMAMCGASSSAALRRCGAGGLAPARLGFHVGRVIGYAAAGAALASGAGLLSYLGQAAPALRPLWTLVHLAAVALGLWLLATGRQPRWMSERPRSLAHATPAPPQAGWQRMAGPGQASMLGAAWVAWPCGLLQSALILATLATSAWAGAAVMTAFAIASSPGLWAAGWIWARGAGERATRWTVRAAGAFLVLGSTWALGHGLWERVLALCASL
ncbi:MAG: sulfite exporter TauE/SafE family protein [Rhizobacter sp.]